MIHPAIFPPQMSDCFSSAATARQGYPIITNPSRTSGRAQGYPGVPPIWWPTMNVLLENIVRFIHCFQFSASDIEGKRV